MPATQFDWQKTGAKGKALLLSVIAIVASLAGGAIFLSSVHVSTTTPVVFDQSSQVIQSNGVKCWSGSVAWFTVPVSTCNAPPLKQAPVNPLSNNTGLSMSLGYLWSNGFASGANGFNVGGVQTTLGSSVPGSNGLSSISLCAVSSCGSPPPANVTSGTSYSTTTTSCSNPQGGFSPALFCPPNSLPVSTYQLAVSQNGAVQRLDQSSFNKLYGENPTAPALASFYYTTVSGNVSTTQTWLFQRYGIDVRLQIQGDQIQIVAKCAYTGTLAVIGSTWGCPQILANAGNQALQFINQYDKATGFITLDIGYPGVPAQQGEVDDFIGAWIAQSSCLFSASTTANSPVVNGAVAPPGGGAVSVPACAPHNAVPYVPGYGSCAPVTDNVGFTFTNSTGPLPAFASACSQTRLQLKINSFGPNYQIVAFNTQGGGDVQGTNCYSLVSANQQAGTQPGCDWGVRFDQGMILDIPIMFDYASYFTVKKALVATCGATCGGNGRGQGTGTGTYSPGPNSTGSTLQVTVVNFLGIPITGATVSLTAGAGQATGPNPCTSGTSGFGQCQFNILPGTWTVTAAENGNSIPILGFSIQFPPLDNVATTQIVILPGANQITLQMGLNLQGGLVLAGFVVGVAIIFLIFIIVIRALGQRKQPIVQVGGRKSL